MSDHDPSLSRVLQSWRHEPPPAPRFRAGVWARIEAARDAPWAFAALFAGRLGVPAQHFRWALPLGATFAFATAAVLGAGAGYMHTSVTKTDRMAEAYIQTIDPLQMTAGYSR